jgi:hypothetical protein
MLKKFAPVRRAVGAAAAKPAAKPRPTATTTTAGSRAVSSASLRARKPVIPGSSSTPRLGLGS